jgi:hypothetical protein
MITRRLCCLSPQLQLLLDVFIIQAPSSASSSGPVFSVATSLQRSILASPLPQLHDHRGELSQSHGVSYIKSHPCEKHSESYEVSTWPSFHASIGGVVKSPDIAALPSGIMIKILLYSTSRHQELNTSEKSQILESTMPFEPPSFLSISGHISHEAVLATYPGLQVETPNITLIRRVPQQV